MSEWSILVFICVFFSILARLRLAPMLLFAVLGASASLTGAR